MAGHAQWLMRSTLLGSGPTSKKDFLQRFIAYLAYDFDVRRLRCHLQQNLPSAYG